MDAFEVIKNSMVKYPMLYGSDPLAVIYSQMFLNGNGLEWRNGELVSRYSDDDDNEFEFSEKDADLAAYNEKHFDVLMIKALGSLGENAILSDLRPDFVFVGHSCFETADAPPKNKWDKILKLVHGQLNVFIANHGGTYPEQVEIAKQVLENFKNNPNTAEL